MAELVGLEKIEDIINRFLKKEFKITAELSEEFQAFIPERIVNYTFAPTSECVQNFIPDAEHRYPGITADPFLWLLFHEVGHIMTENMWTQDERNYFNDQKRKYFYIGDETEEELQEASFAYIDEELLSDIYHAMPDEFMATRWAGDYMVKNGRKVAKFWAKLQPAILEFYALNDVDIEEE